MKNRVKFIWGIEANHDSSYKDSVTIFTLNDFDIVYYFNEGKYKIDIETIYLFNEVKFECQYLKNILSKFTEWMLKTGRNADFQLHMYDVFSGMNNIHSGFDSIEEAYAMFKMLVNGYCHGKNDEGVE